MNRQQKILFLIKLSQGKIGIRDLIPKSMLIVVGVDNDVTMFYLDEKNVDQVDFDEYLFSRPGFKNGSINFTILITEDVI